MIFVSEKSRRLLLWVFVLIIVVFLREKIEAEKVIRARAIALSLKAIDCSQLVLGDEAVGMESREINLQEPEEFDFKTRAEVLDLRSGQVAAQASLVKGDYHPSQTLFGQITDGKPWWGLMGQYCDGPGEKGIEGASEESRFLLNPFLLLGVNENNAWVVKGPCFPVYPRPVSLHWDAALKTASVVYDMSRFWREWKEVPPRSTWPSFYLVNYNARDFGFNYVAISKKHSFNIKSYGTGRFFKEPVDMRAFIHTGGSCGFPGGCNNQSPTEPDIEFWVKELPAQMECKLWKNFPANIDQPADFTFIINFE